MKSKNKGITLLETMISLGLLSIFSLVIFSPLKISSSLSREVEKKSLLERDSIRVINVIERSISRSSSFKEEYEGKRYLESGIGIMEEKLPLVSVVDSGSFSKCSYKGNTLFLEYPRGNGVRIENSILLFQFIEDNLNVGFGKVVAGKIKVNEYDTIYEGVIGEFKREESGIIIECEFFNNSLEVREKIKGYENINIY